MISTPELERSKRRTAALSVASNATLVAGKVVVGRLTGSVAIVSEAIHSAMDLLASIIALVAVTLSGKPPDRDHPHGHGKIEDLSGAIEALLIFAAVVFIAYEAVEKLLRGGKVEQVWLGSAVMGFSAAVNTVVSILLERVGKRTDSNALLADAAHLRTDVYTSLGVFAGLLLVELTQVQWLDPATALAVGLLIVFEAWRITRRSVAELLDEGLPDADREVVERVIRDAGLTFHALRTRKSGPTRQIDLHLEVSPSASVDQIHEVCDRVEAEIERALPGTNLLIHPEPHLDLDSARPALALVETILSRHPGLFLESGDLTAHETPSGIDIAFRLRFAERTSLTELHSVIDHLTAHILEHFPAARVFVHPTASPLDDPAAIALVPRSR
jgi:cation diffusion facilitator family transporter